MVKIDVEDAEFDVLCGARGVLEEHHPVVIMEIWKRRMSQPASVNARKLMKSMGYEPHLITEDGVLIPVTYSKLKRIEFDVENIVYV